MHYEAGRLDSALEDLQQSSFGEGGQSSTVHYLKGMIYWKQSRTVEALLSF